MSENKTCPLCTFDGIVQDEYSETITDTFGGSAQIQLVRDRCERCHAEGDFDNVNDSVVKEGMDALKLEGVRRILKDFSEHKYNAAGLERSLGLPQRTLTKWKTGVSKPSAAGVALVKFIRLFPWLVDVANCKFDYDAAQRIYIESGVKRLLSEISFNQSLGHAEMSHGIEFHFYVGNPPPIDVDAAEEFVPWKTVNELVQTQQFQITT